MGGSHGSSALNDLERAERAQFYEEMFGELYALVASSAAPAPRTRQAGRSDAAGNRPVLQCDDMSIPQGTDTIISGDQMTSPGHARLEELTWPARQGRGSAEGPEHLEREQHRERQRTPRQKEQKVRF